MWSGHRPKTDRGARDELAHTNAPDSKNRKRYEDVEDLLRAGINVISTVNIQHLESLYNFVEEATGVRVKERVPDEIVAQADQIVNIDLPAEDLQERLQAGKIYPEGAHPSRAREFFTEKNLTRLREMTLSETANYLDRHNATTANRQKRQRSRSGNGRYQQPGPDPGRLLRKTARLASQLNAQWYAVYVRTPEESAVRIDAAAQRRVTDTLETAQKMGGLVFSMKGEDVAQSAHLLRPRIRHHPYRRGPPRTPKAPAFVRTNPLRAHPERTARSRSVRRLAACRTWTSVHEFSSGCRLARRRPHA